MAPLKVRYYCHFQSTGYGRAALEYILAMSKEPGIDMDVRALGGRQGLPWRLRGKEHLFGQGASHVVGGAPDVVLVHTLPRDCERVLEIEEKEGNLRSGTPAAAYTTWEALTLPRRLVDALTPFQMVLTPSEASGRPLAAQGVRARIVPHAYDVDLYRQEDERPPRADRSMFTFYYLGAWNRRKNPEGLIRAFVHAFPPRSHGAGDGDRPVQLVLYTGGSSGSSSLAQVQVLAAIAATGYEAHELPHVLVVNERLTDEAVHDLHRESDVFVTASRGEAWNLGAFEAMLAGRHVIAPAGHGSDDFLKRTSAKRYASIEAPAAQDVQASVGDDGRVELRVTGPTGLTSSDLWLEPDLLDLSDAMQLAYHRDIRTLHLTSGFRPDLRYSHAVVGEHLLRDLAEVAGMAVTAARSSS